MSKAKKSYRGIARAIHTNFENELVNYDKESRKEVTDNRIRKIERFLSSMMTFLNGNCVNINELSDDKYTEVTAELVALTKNIPWDSLDTRLGQIKLSDHWYRFDNEYIEIQTAFMLGMEKVAVDILKYTHNYNETMEEQSRMRCRAYLLIKQEVYSRNPDMKEKNKLSQQEYQDEAKKVAEICEKIDENEKTRQEAERVKCSEELEAKKREMKVKRDKHLESIKAGIEAKEAKKKAERCEKLKKFKADIKQAKQREQTELIEKLCRYFSLDKMSRENKLWYSCEDDPIYADRWEWCIREIKKKRILGKGLDLQEIAKEVVIEVYKIPYEELFKI